MKTNLQESREMFISLKFNNTVRRLAGYPYGKAVFNEQVRDSIDYNCTVYIDFPEQIIRVASSFVQGFFEEIIQNVGFLGIGKRVVIRSPHREIVDSIMKNLM